MAPGWWKSLQSFVHDRPGTASLLYLVGVGIAVSVSFAAGAETPSIAKLVVHALQVLAAVLALLGETHNSGRQLTPLGVLLLFSLPIAGVAEWGADEFSSEHDKQEFEALRTSLASEVAACPESTRAAITPTLHELGERYHADSSATRNLMREGDAHAANSAASLAGSVEAIDEDVNGSDRRVRHRIRRLGHALYGRTDAGMPMVERIESTVRAEGAASAARDRELEATVGEAGRSIEDGLWGDADAGVPLVERVVTAADAVGDRVHEDLWGTRSATRPVVDEIAASDRAHLDELERSLWGTTDAGVPLVEDLRQEVAALRGALVCPSPPPPPACSCPTIAQIQAVVAAECP